MAKTTAKDVILLCKGWYDKEKYTSKLSALKQYYRERYCCDMEDVLREQPERFLLRTVIEQAMYEVINNYPDRLRGFINGYVIASEIRLFGIPDRELSYDEMLFYRIVSFFSSLQMRGDGLIEIDTEDYFEKDFNEKYERTTRERLQFHENKTVLKENIIR